MSTYFSYFVKKVASPFWSFAIHDGNHINSELNAFLMLSEAARFREEDPYTAIIAELPTNQFIVGTSRFQLDINRKLADAVYLRPEQAWGLDVWKDLPKNHIDALHKAYTDTFKNIDACLKQTIDTYGYFVVLDIHSYNCKREGSHEEVDKDANPQINLGTAHNLPKWNALIQHSLDFVRSQKYLSENIDIRENVKFKGGYLSEYINEKYGNHGCVLSFEFRKDFMDEWSGEPQMERIMAYRQLLMHVVKELTNHLKAYANQ